MVIQMFTLNENLEIIAIESFIAFFGYIINYIASRKDFGYTRVSFKSLVNDCYFIYTHGVSLENYLLLFFGKKTRIQPKFIAFIIIVIEVFLTEYNQEGGVLLFFFLAVSLLIVDFTTNKKYKIQNMKALYLPLFMKGVLPDKKLKWRPFLYSVVRYLVLLNGYAFLSLMLVFIIISHYGLNSTSITPAGYLLDVFFFVYLFGMFAPTHKNFNWLIHGYNLVINEIDKYEDIYLRIYLDYPGASASLPLEGKLVLMKPKFIIKTSEGDSNWYETVKWKQIKRISVRLVEKSSKQVLKSESDL